jgi:hypothetical protein
MPRQRTPFRCKNRIASRPVALAGILLVGLTSLLIETVAWGQEKSQKDARKDKDISVTVKGPDTDAGLILSANATAKEVGLPIYPGSIPYKEPEKDNDSSAVKMGLWGTSFGFKLVVLKMESKDETAKIAHYYQNALAKYGTVLDCTNAPPQQAKEDKSEKLTCGTDKPDPGGMLFKAGTAEKQHMVAVQPKANGAVFQLLYIEKRDEKKQAE